MMYACDHQQNKQVRPHRPVVDRSPTRRIAAETSLPLSFAAQAIAAVTTAVRAIALSLRHCRQSVNDDKFID
jgi:hypothetical protein